MLPLEAIYTLAIKRCAGVAQSVEQLIRNEKVGCSIHLSGTNQINNLALLHKSGAFLFGVLTDCLQTAVPNFLPAINQNPL